MISHKHQCIFIHIPKCAGTSIEKALGHFDSNTGKVWQDHRSLRMIEQPLIIPNVFSSIENLIEVRRRIHHQFLVVHPLNKLTVTKEQYSNYYKFTFIRNPWARAFSMYKNVMRDNFHKKNYEIAGELSFKKFLRLHSGKGLLRPQTYWIKDFSASITLDFIGRFETLIEDFHQVCKAMHLPQITLPHKIKGSDEDYREYYDWESIDIIDEIYQEEIKMFGYSFSSHAPTKID